MDTSTGNLKTEMLWVFLRPVKFTIYHGYESSNLKHTSTERWETGQEQSVLPVKKVKSPFFPVGCCLLQMSLSCAMMALQMSVLTGRFECVSRIVSLSA